MDTGWPGLDHMQGISHSKSALSCVTFFCQSKFEMDTALHVLKA